MSDGKIVQSSQLVRLFGDFSSLISQAIYEHSCVANLYILLFRLIDSKLEDRGFAASFSDPVLSGSATVAFDASQRLIEEILETGAMSRVDAKKLVQDLCRRTHTAVGEIAQQHTFHLDRAPLRKGDRIDLEGHAPVYTLVYHRKSWKKPFCIKLNSTHYDKLKAMFERVHGGLAGGCSLQWTESMTGKATKLTHSFNLLVMVLMLRYSSLSGGQLLLDLRGGGMQGAVHGDVFKVLRKHFSDQPLFECFGSPLNAYLPTFGSAFSADLDWHFGSMGNFLDMTIESGCCEANPPFSPGMMNVMAEKIESNLLVADELSSSLTFFVIVPNAGDNKDSQRAAAKRFGGVSLQKMRASTTCRKHILLSAKEHGYVEGAQHLRSTRYKESLYDTSVVILQSREARLRELDINALEAEIRIAFVSRHREETDRRKQERENDTANSLPVHLSTCATLD